MNRIIMSLTTVVCCVAVIISDAAGDELVVFSGRKEALIAPVIELFEKETGIDVILKAGESAALGQQILQEGANPSADVFIAKESGSLEFLRLKGAFQPYSSDRTKEIPANLKASDDTWFGVSGRSRAIIYNKTMIDIGDVPTTLEALTDPKYKGKIAAANGGNESFIAWVSALRIYFNDDAKVKELLLKLKENEVQLLSDSHTDVRKAVGRGEFPLGLINHYYYHLQKHETDAATTNVDIVYLDQDEGARGEIVNVAGAAIVKGAAHGENAQKFIDFLLSQEAQQLFAEVNFEYPLVPSIKTHPEVLEALHCQKESALECLRQMNVGLDQLGEKLESTTQMLEEVNWF